MVTKVQVLSPVKKATNAIAESFFSLRGEQFLYGDRSQTRFFPIVNKKQLIVRYEFFIDKDENWIRVTGF